ncbi:hypothetical protein UT300012_23280 [Paraclostridium bifermentans]
MSSKYEQVVRDLREAQKELHLKRTEKNDTENSIIVQRKQYDALTSDMNGSIKKERTKALAEEEKRISQPIELKIGQLRDKKTDLKRKYDKACSELTFDNYKDRYEDELNIVNTARDSMSDIQERVKGVLGDKFSRALYKQLDNSTIDISVDDLADLSRRLGRFEKNIEILSRKSKIDYTGVVDGLLKKLNPCKDETAEGALKNDVLLYVGLCAALSFFTLSVGAPYLVLGLTTLGGLNVYKGYSTYRLVLESKLLADNIDRIDDLVANQVNTELDEAKTKLTDIYDRNCEKINSRLDKYENQLTDELMKVRDTFQFNEDEIRQRFELKKRTINQDIQRVQQSVDRLEIEIGQITSNINKLNKELEGCIDQLADHYLSTTRVGKEQILNPKFLIDIDNNTRQPEFFEFKKETTLFVYEEYEDLCNFIQIMLIQIMNRLNVGSVNMFYWDLKYMASAVQPFNDLDENYLKICTDKETLEASAVDIIKALEARYKQVAKMHLNIDEYNQDMVDSKSVPESYNFMFIVKPEYKDLVSVKYSKILETGPRVGIYPLIFINSEELEALGKDGIKLLEPVQNVYSLINGRLKPVAKRVYVKMLESKK